MYSAKCVCGRYIGLPDANVCPYCKKVLFDQTDEYIRKHIRNCTKTTVDEPKTHRRGRPPRIASAEIEKEVIPMFRRSCRNCGKYRCVGKEDSDTYNEWIVQTVDLCSCGRRPSEDWRNGCLYSIRCGWCNLTMESFHDKYGTERLITMWNERMKSQ